MSGLGCTGQLHAQLLRERGARVLGVTRSAEKRELAADLSCEWTASPDDAQALVTQLDARGADLVVECAGTVETMNLAAQLARPGGVVLAYGVQTRPDTDLDSYTFYKKELDLIRSRANHPRDLEIAVRLTTTGAVRLAPLVSERMPLERIGEALEHSAAGSLKVVLEHR
jgi:L-iditol 2-dehydrogenase